MAARAQARRNPLLGSRLGLWEAIGLSAPFLAVPLALLAAYNPGLALALGATVVVLTLCVLRVDIAILLLVGAAPLESAVQISSNQTFTITKVVGAVCFASFAIYAMTARQSIVLDRSHAIVFLLLALALISTVQAQEVNAAFATTIRYMSFVALYVVVSQFLGSETLQRRVAWVLAVTSALAGGQAIYNFLGHSGHLVATPTYGDANDLAFLLATVLPITLWLFYERGIRLLLVVGLVATISTAIVLTFSRGALVGLAAGAVWHFATERRHLKILILGLLVATVMSFAFVRSNRQQFEVGLKAKENVAGLNISSRLDGWSVASRLASDSPIFGIGPGNFQFRYPEATDRIVTTDPLKVVHNAYLDIAAELGFVGLFLFLAYLAETFSRLTSVCRTGGGIPGFAAAVRTSLIVAMVSALFLSEQYYAPFWLLGGIATGLWAQSRREARGRTLPAGA